MPTGITLGSVYLEVVHLLVAYILIAQFYHVKDFNSPCFLVYKYGAWITCCEVGVKLIVRVQ